MNVEVVDNPVVNSNCIKNESLENKGLGVNGQQLLFDILRG